MSGDDADNKLLSIELFASAATTGGGSLEVISAVACLIGAESLPTLTFER
jgi:hypothetical protein